MDFELSHAQQEIKGRTNSPTGRRGTLRRFSRSSLGGSMGPCVLEEYGGGGTDFLSYVRLISSISRAGADVGVVLVVHVSAGTLPTFTYGNEEQKARFVADLARGEKIGCLA